MEESECVRDGVGSGGGSRGSLEGRENHGDRRGRLRNARRRMVVCVPTKIRYEWSVGEVNGEGGLIGYCGM